jgi:murein DD-endopeptidase MepM/ murein hydrolase activator NlpD
MELPVPKASMRGWSATFTYALVSLFALALLFTAAGVTAPPAAAALGDQISAVRSAQLHWEKAMRKHDKQLQRKKPALKKIKKKYRASKKQLKRLQKRRRVATRTMRSLTAKLARIEEKAAADGETVPEYRQERLDELRGLVNQARADLRRIAVKTKKAHRIKMTRKRRLAKIRRKRQAIIRRRESAEASLAGLIIRATSLAQQRVELRSDARLNARDDSRFVWPSDGRISQRYGCTGFRLNPPRGSCRHFHDGLDIVAGYGAPVKAAAVGVVAYVGWNPWDSGKRAMIVVVGHPDGFVTRYGHILPNRVVRVGELVRKGDRVGKMGSTGKSTGVHLHFEMLKGRTTVDPTNYLPSRSGSDKKDKKDKKKKGGADRKTKSLRTPPSIGQGPADPPACDPDDGVAADGVAADGVAADADCLPTAAYTTRVPIQGGSPFRGGSPIPL